MYVGSSSSLARRLIGYFKGTHADVGKFIPLLKKEGVNEFTLEVIPLTDEYYDSLELSIEQYFLLQYSSKFNLNTLKVVNKMLSPTPTMGVRALLGAAGVRFYSSSSVQNKSDLYTSVLIYLNIEQQKEQILVDNKGKSGIYLWTNLKNGKSYVGSGVDLKIRLGRYLNINFLQTRIKVSQSLIYSALLKYKYSSFKLEILEYCDRSDVIDRENFYLNLLKPEYNILKVAGSSLGYKHTEDTKNKIIASLAGKFSGENNSMFGLLGENHPRFGGTHTEEARLRISKSKGVSLEVLDLETNVVSSYFSMQKAAKALGCNASAICKGLKKSNPYVLKGRFKIKRD